MLEIIIYMTLTFFVVIMLGYHYATRERQVASERLGRYVTAQSGQISSAPGPAKVAKWREVVRYLSRYVNRVPKARYFEEQIQQAGIPLKGSEFIVLSIGLALITGLVFMLLAKGSVAVAAVTGIAAYLMMLTLVNIKIRRRLADFNNQLGDTLSLLANALRSGFSFFQAVEMVAEEMKPPVSQEFARVMKEMSLGATTDEALSNLVNRVKSDDLELVVTAVLIQRQIGGNLAQILDNIAATIRERIMMKREVRAITAQGRLSGWIVGLLPIVMVGILMMLSPEYMKTLFTDPLGPMLIVAGLISELIGVVIISKIVDIDM